MTRPSPRRPAHVRTLVLDIAPFDLFRRLQRRFGNTFLLESMEGPERLARYSILGFNPTGLVSVRHGQVQVIGDLPLPEPDERPADYLRRVLRWPRVANDGPTTARDRDEAGSQATYAATDRATATPHETRPGTHASWQTDAATPDVPFDGGLVGYFGYDYVRYVERLPDTQDDDEGWPDALFGLYEDGLVYDHAAETYRYFSHDDDRSHAIVAAAEDVAPDAGTRGPLRIGPLSPNMDQATFEDGVRRLQHHIKEGDVFQAVLSKRLTAEYRGDITGLYERLRESNPSPYMYHMTLGERHIIGSSPEMLVRVETDHWQDQVAGASTTEPSKPETATQPHLAGHATVETFPIAGTRPLGATEHETQALAEDLLADAKENAEHEMLVDLARNDLGRIAAYGTVHVPDHRTIERYSHVQHIVSRVTARLGPDKDALDAFEAVFPAGTVSGAPKVRAMELLERFEPTRRGPYAGAVGYIAFNGNLDTAITIRTLTATHRRVSIQSGAGIVQDSDPTKEWEETEHKARALVTTLKDHATDDTVPRADTRNTPEPASRPADLEAER